RSVSRKDRVPSDTRTVGRLKLESATIESADAPPVALHRSDTGLVEIGSPERAERTKPVRPGRRPIEEELSVGEGDTSRQHPEGFTTIVPCRDQSPEGFG